jgi:hypothetical protein
MNTSMSLTWLAEAHAVLGRPDKALNCLAEAARIVETTDERVSEAELLHRIPGDLRNAAGDRYGAERHYRQAIVVAKRQSATLPIAGIGQPRPTLARPRCAEARQLLDPIYNTTGSPKVSMRLT